MHNPKSNNANCCTMPSTSGLSAAITLHLGPEHLSPIDLWSLPRGALLKPSTEVSKVSIHHVRIVSSAIFPLLECCQCHIGCTCIVVVQHILPTSGQNTKSLAVCSEIIVWQFVGPAQTIYLAKFQATHNMLPSKLSNRVIVVLAACHIYYMHTLYIIHILYVYIKLYTCLACRPQCQ